jgi:hypothetical protein
MDDFPFDRRRTPATGIGTVTDEKPSPPQREYGFRFFKGRRLAPLVGPWISSAIFAGLVYYAEKTIPALHDVAGIIYWMLLAIVTVATARWARVRGGDRRAADRRKSRSRS